MGSETEYFAQQPGLLFWLGYALGRGITVHMISGDDIFDRPVYGYEGYILASPVLFRERVDELRRAVKDARKVARDAEERLEEGWSNGVDDFISAAAAAQNELGKLEGMLFENERYLFKIEQMERDNELPWIDRNEYEMSAADANKVMLKLGPMVYRTVGHVDMTLSTFKYTKNPLHLPQLQAQVKNHLDANYDYGRAQGKFEENRRLAIDTDKKVKAAGGIKTVQSVMGAPLKEHENA